MHGWKPHDKDQGSGFRQYHETLVVFLYDIEHNDLQEICKRIAQVVSCLGVHPESFQKQRPEQSNELKQLII